MKSKNHTVPPTTRDEAIELLGKIRAETIALRRLQLEREAQIKSIDDRFVPDIEAHQERIELLAGALESWAAENPREFGPIKSIECQHGKFGFRITPPAVRPIRPLTWAKVLENLERFEHFARFIRIKKEPDREALIAARDELTPDQLRAIGVRITQDEIFFVDPKLDDGE